MKKETKENEMVFPNKEVKNLWTNIYKEIKKAVDESADVPTPLEKRVREVLKKHLGTELIRTDAGYQKFFKDALRFAINMDTDKILYRIEVGRNHYGSNNHSKGKITGEFMPEDKKEEEY